METAKNDLTDKNQDDLIDELINSKQDMMEDEDGTRSLFRRKPRDTYIPSKDPEPEKRLKFLDENKEQYQYDHTIVPPVPLLSSVPKKEEFSAGYLIKRGLAMADLIPNMIQVKIKNILDPLDNLESFSELFVMLPKPTTAETWSLDENFAEQRLSGPNPIRVHRVKTFEDIPLDLGMRENVVPGYTETIESAIENNRLYYVDYRDLSWIQGTPGEKYVPTPTAIFYWHEEHDDAHLKFLMGQKNFGRLMPVAIQIKPDFPVYHPHTVEPDDWRIAKWCVQIADGNDHEMRVHLALTHMVMEPFAIACERQFAENHPVGQLLRPHFRFMVYNNNSAVVKLLGKGGFVDHLLGGTIEESVRIATDGYESWHLFDSAFPNEIKARGMNLENAMPNYPYRDDGLLIWNAIAQFVKNYISIYYKSKKDLEGDVELQAWVSELKDKSKGRVNGMPEKIDDRNLLIEILTNILFTCSAQHSAANFSQYDYMANVANMPLGAYCPLSPPGSQEFRRNDFDMLFLPPADRTELQVKVAVLLSAYRHDKLGFYENYDFSDEKAEEVIRQFQEDLKHVENKISVRNVERIVSYEYMKPSEVLNSISI